MADNDGTTTDDTGADTDTTEPVDLAAEVEKWKALSRKNEAQAKKNATAAERLEKIEQDKLSEIEKANQRATAAEERAAKLELNQTRADVAKAKELPAYLATRLQGSTKEELEADADALIKEMNLGKKAPDLKQGKQGGKTPATGEGFMDSFIKGNR